MKRKAILLSLSCCLCIAYSQPLPDSIWKKYDQAKNNREKGNCLVHYLEKSSINDSNATRSAFTLLSRFRKNKDETGANYTQVRISNILTAKGDYPAALNLLFPLLSRFETNRDSFGISQTYYAIASAYLASKEYELAAEYSKKVIPFILDGNEKILSQTYNSIGCIYGEGAIPDSGMLYAQKAVNMDTKLKDYEHLGISISTLGENYIAANEYDIALPFLKKSLDYYQTADPGNYLTVYLRNDFAQVYLATKHYDSAEYYANQALSLSIPWGYKYQSMRSYEYLYKAYELAGQQDSVNKYFRLAMTTKDMLFDLEKTRSIQALTFREELRQQEINTDKIRAADERKQNLQFAFIALAIVGMLTLFLLLSRSFITNTKLIAFFGVVALLLVFEFINLLLHPFLESVTNHSPFLMLITLVIIAGLLAPLHHRIEKWATSKLLEKNKQIRLAIAKKTIAKLENSSKV